MSEIKYLRLTIDVALFEGSELIGKTLTKKSEGSTVPSEDGKSVEKERFYHFGTGERLAREFMNHVQRGNIEIDEIYDVEIHG